MYEEDGFIYQAGRPSLGCRLVDGGGKFQGEMADFLEDFRKRRVSDGILVEVTEAAVLA